AVSVAGPGIQLILWFALWALFTQTWSPLWWPKLMIMMMGQPDPEAGLVTPSMSFRVLMLVLGMLIVINLWWALLNLLPIWPLDGGMISRELCTGASRINGLVVSLWISLIAAAVIAINAFFASSTGTKPIPYLPGHKGNLFTPIFFAMFAVQSFQLLQEERHRRAASQWDSDDRLPWER